MDRPSFQEIYLKLAADLAKRSTCKRLQVGCVTTSNDFSRVFGIGYNGNAKGFANTCDSDEAGKCGCLHAEENALLKTNIDSYIAKIVFITHQPCVMCAKRLINKGGVEKVYYTNDYRLRDGLDALDRAGIKYARYS